jgi:diguanylate cyclase (GGDEF)-like protein
MTASRAATQKPEETDPTVAANARRVLEVMEQAVSDMREFLQMWHRAIICARPPEKKLLAADSHTKTRFGRWFADHGEKRLVAQPVFRELADTQKQIHDHARMLALSVQGGGHAIPTAEYDSLMTKVNAYYAITGRIRDAFEKAVSELDPLTGLHNRQVMTSELDAEYERAVRNNQPLCIGLTDIDKFKVVNDTYGHAAGDTVLTAVGGRFLSFLRPYDTIYRYGGEEFLVCLPNSNLGTANSVLERLRTGLEEKPITLDDGRELKITSSFGLAQVDGNLPLKQILERADKALYTAKQRGRNRVVTWSDGLADAAK